ncbi:hypothetical protein APHMUC_0498 [Anaplasma phagocytophilum str. ApMUC09]|uniref:Uncharacterized protein n=1 Tax=Anaplasma phagocytophilum str. ApMUC09 TaxID=1359152 RepID=A0A0F3N9F2_ANAPH|nr:hypothetical protein APHMUC_0498 [Anaplasma phagocytophilum str. ApMUC09]
MCRLICNVNSNITPDVKGPPSQFSYTHGKIPKLALQCMMTT